MGPRSYVLGAIPCVGISRRCSNRTRGSQRTFIMSRRSQSMLHVLGSRLPNQSMCFPQHALRPVCTSMLLTHPRPTLRALASGFDPRSLAGGPSGTACNQCSPPVVTLLSNKHMRFSDDSHIVTNMRSPPTDLYVIWLRRSPSFKRFPGANERTSNPRNQCSPTLEDSHFEQYQVFLPCVTHRRASGSSLKTSTDRVASTPQINGEISLQRNQPS